MVTKINLFEMLDACAAKPPYPSCFVFRSVRDEETYEKELHTSEVFKTIKAFTQMAATCLPFQNMIIDDDGNSHWEV